MSGADLLHVVRAGAIGDVLWCEPVLRALAPRHERIVFHTRFGDLLAGALPANVAFSERLSVPRKAALRARCALHRREQILDLDMAYETRTRMHILHAYQEVAGLPRTVELPRLPPAAADPTPAGLPTVPYVALHLETTSARNYRRVHGVAWERVVGRIRDLGAEVVQIGARVDPVPGARVVTTSLRELVTVVRRAALFVGGDSGPSHVAVAAGRPTLAFFGAVDPRYRHFPEFFRGRVLQGPCEFAGCYHGVVAKDGPLCRVVGDTGVPPCATHETDAVLAALEALWKEHVARC